MGASKYAKDRRRIYEEATKRGAGWQRKALKRLNDEYGASSIKRSGKVVGVRLDDSGLVICKKKSFKTRERAEEALEQITRYRPAHQTAKPCRIYTCPHCGNFHLTSMKEWTPFHSDSDGE